MNREKTFRGRFNRRMHGLQDTAELIEEKVMDQASAIADQTKASWKRSRKAVSAWEQDLEDSVKSRPMLYLGVAVGLIGLLLAKMMFDRSHR